MGFFRRKPSEGGGVRAIAVVQSRRRDSGEDESERARSAPHTIDLEVHLDGRDPYRVVDTFKVPRAYWNIAQGVELPVLVVPARPERVTIDWDAFEAAGGRETVSALGDQYKRDAVREIVMQDEVQHASAIATVEEWLGEVNAGRMTSADFVGYVGEYVEGGFMSAEEGKSAKQRALDPAP